MSEPDHAAPPEPVLRRRSGPSLVWLIPLLTALIGGWLIFKTLAEKGLPEAVVALNEVS